MGFPIGDIPPILLGKVIGKTHYEDYFRLQQTCKSMRDFAQTNEHIKVYIDGMCWVTAKTISFCSYDSKYDTKPLDVKIFCGTRFRDFYLKNGFPESQQDFDKFYTKIKDNHITCMRLMGQDTTLTNEQYKRIMKVLKPVHVCMTSVLTDAFEAVFHIKELKEVDIALELTPSEILGLMTNLLPRFTHVRLHINKNSLSDDEIPTFFLLVLQILTMETKPHLKKFELNSTTIPRASIELLETLKEFQPTLTTGDDWPVAMTCTVMEDFNTIVSVSSYSADIRYERKL